MSLRQLVEPFTWYKYSKKVTARIENPRCAGTFDSKASEERGVRQVDAEAGSTEEGNIVWTQLLVDREDGIIVDACFKAFGQSALIAASDAACELCVGKNYDQVSRLTPEHIDKFLRDKAEVSAFPKEAYSHIELALEAVLECAEQCRDIPLSINYVAPPVPTDKLDVSGEGYPGWMDLPYQKKIEVIEKVLDDDVRPYISLDAGGVHVLNLINNKEVVVGYSGTCTSCYASVGSTLSYIQQVLKAKVHQDITVTPDI